MPRKKQIRRKIICLSCGMERQLCAKGLCKGCYDRGKFKAYGVRIPEDLMSKTKNAASEHGMSINETFLVFVEWGLETMRKDKLDRQKHAA